MHIELTEMLRCPERHEEGFLVLSTGEMRGRMVRSGVLACPKCAREYAIVKGVVRFSRSREQEAGSGAVRSATAPRSPLPAPVDAQTLQAFLDLSGPGGYVLLLGSAAQHAVGLAGLMGGVHFVAVNAPDDVEELPVLSLLDCDTMIPLRQTVARAVVVGPDRLGAEWLAEARRVLLPGRRLVIESEQVAAPAGLTRLALGHGLFVGERR
ncbi:MAG: hypothetical protein DMD56_10650 [Gemmatimonadetes bacterium]|nr:MAG: hypothetical protein DMD56_10650 [Gemmatimonadota bacterium]